MILKTAIWENQERLLKLVTKLNVYVLIVIAVNLLSAVIVGNIALIVFNTIMMITPYIIMLSKNKWEEKRNVEKGQSKKRRKKDKHLVKKI